MIVSFTTQKGGSTKTTTTMLVATYLHYYYDYKICVIDLDAQQSISQKRDREIELIVQVEKQAQENPSKYYPTKIYKNLKSLGDKGLYQIFSYSFDDSNLIEKINEAKKEFDIVFLDFPGTLDKEEITRVLMMVDYFFVPFYCEEKHCVSSINFVNVLKKISATNKGQIKDYYAYLTKYSNHVKKAEWKIVEEILTELNIKMLKSKLYDNPELELYASTFMVNNVTDEKSPLKLVEEILTLIK